MRMCSWSARTWPWAARGARLPGLADEFGRRARSQHADQRGGDRGIAIGAAQSGLRPVVEIMFVDFVTLALDQLVNQAAKAHLHVGGWGLTPWHALGRVGAPIRRTLALLGLRACVEGLSQ
jgi:pyruvate/2-oxoglutarate/acetoin dehydrogenase E1 component